MSRAPIARFVHNRPENIGDDGSGTHCAASNEYGSALVTGPSLIERINLVPSGRGRAAFANFLGGTGKGGLQPPLARAGKFVWISP